MFAFFVALAVAAARLFFFFLMYAFELRIGSRFSLRYSSIFSLFEKSLQSLEKVFCSVCVCVCWFCVSNMPHFGLLRTDAANGVLNTDFRRCDHTTQSYTESEGGGRQKATLRKCGAVFPMTCIN